MTPGWMLCLSAEVPTDLGTTAVTVYTDNVNNLWRVKPGPGERVHKMFHMKATEAESRKQWATVFAYVKSLKQT